MYQDLHPYCCTFETCATADRLYDSRHAWFAHELDAHHSIFQCVDGCSKTFQTRAEFELHVKSRHEDLAAPRTFSALMRTSAQISSLADVVTCELCNKRMTLRALQKHLGHHQEQLALFALPPNLDDTEDDQENAGQDVPLSDESDLDEDDGDHHDMDDVSGPEEVDDEVVMSTEDESSNERDRIILEYEIGKAFGSLEGLSEEEKQRVVSRYVQKQASDAERRETEHEGILLEYEVAEAKRKQKERAEFEAFLLKQKLHKQKEEADAKGTPGSHQAQKQASDAVLQETERGAIVLENEVTNAKQTQKDRADYEAYLLKQQEEAGARGAPGSHRAQTSEEREHEDQERMRILDNESKLKYIKQRQEREEEDAKEREEEIQRTIRDARARRVVDDSPKLPEADHNTTASEEERARIILDYERRKELDETLERNRVSEERARIILDNERRMALEESSEQSDASEDRARIVAEYRRRIGLDEASKRTLTSEEEKARVIFDFEGGGALDAEEKEDERQALHEQLRIEKARVEKQVKALDRSLQAAVDAIIKSRAGEAVLAEEQEGISYQNQQKMGRHPDVATRKEHEAPLSREEEVEAADTAPKAAEDEELEAAMRKRLEQFGFENNQIENMIRPPDETDQQQAISSSDNPFKTTPLPTYAKIHKKHLDVDTLHYYDIPYEYDEDPDYIIVLRTMTQRETEILFEHTRRLRSNHGQRLFAEADGSERRGKIVSALKRRKSQ